MSKALLLTAAAVMFCIATSRVQAEAPSSDTLSVMGLSSLQMMSDADAMEVRGMGYEPRRPSRRGHSQKSKGPSSSAWGKSKASIDGHTAEADTENGYKAYGRYGAAGSNFSEATKIWTEVETTTGIDGVLTHSVTKSIHVEAGGSSSAMSL
jgi:hypothetical protein